MATTLVASVGASMSAATGRPGQGHLVFGANNQKWYLLYLTGTNNLNVAFSANANFTSTWTAGSTPFALAAAHNSEGRNYGFAYESIASNDIVHMNSTYFVSTSSVQTRHARFTLDSTSAGWSTSASEASITSRNSSVAGNPSGASTIIAVDGKIYDCSSYITSGSTLGDQRFEINATADTAASWTPGTWALGASYTAATPFVTSFAFGDIGTGTALNVCDNASAAGFYTQLEWTKWGGSTWSAAATVLASTVTSAGTNMWGMVARTATDVHVVATSNNSNAYVHRRFNGTNWTTLSGASIPTLTFQTNSGLFLATDGTSVWLFAIEGVTQTPIRYIKWNGSAWDAAWSTLDSGSANLRSYITGFPLVSNNSIGVCWTEHNGANYDIMGAALGFSITSALATGDVAVAAPLLTASGTGNVSTTLATGNVAVAAPSLTGGPTGNVSVSLAVSDVTVGAPSLTGAPTGSASTTLSTGDVVVAAPAIAGAAGVSAALLDVADVAVAAPLLVASGTGTASTTLATSNITTAAPLLTAIGTGSTSESLPVGNVAVSAPALTASGTGNISLSLGIGNVSTQAPALTGAGGASFRDLDPVAGVAVAAPSLSASGTGGTSTTLDVGNTIVAAPLLTGAPTGSAVGSLPVADSVVAAPALVGGPTGGIDRTPGVADIVVSAPALTGAPTGTVTQSLPIADVATAAPSVTGAPTGSISTSLNVSDIIVNAPPVTGTIVGFSVLDTANVAVDAPSLAGGATGNVSSTLSTTNLPVSAPLLTGAATGTSGTSLGTSNVGVAAPALTGLATGVASYSLFVGNVSLSAPDLIVSLAPNVVELSVATVSAASPALSCGTSGGPIFSLGTANVLSDGIPFSNLAADIFSISPQFTTLLN